MFNVIQCTLDLKIVFHDALPHHRMREKKNYREKRVGGLKKLALDEARHNSKIAKTL